MMITFYPQFKHVLVAQKNRLVEMVLMSIITICLVDGSYEYP